jgi:hypothetical protein
VVWIAIGGSDAVRTGRHLPQGHRLGDRFTTIGVPVWAFTGQHRFAREGANRAGTIPTGAPEALLALTVVTVTTIWLSHDVATSNRPVLRRSPRFAALARLLAGVQPAVRRVVAARGRPSPEATAAGGPGWVPRR